MGAILMERILRARLGNYGDPEAVTLRRVTRITVIRRPILLREHN